MTDSTRSITATTSSSNSSTICNSTTLAHLTKRIVLHENERCWLGRGFTAGGLLPNDRGRYSTLDGSTSWKTLEEANDDLLGTSGFWKWRQQDFENEAEEEQADEVNQTEEEEETTTDNRNELEENATEDKSVSRNNSKGEWMYARDFTVQSVRDAKPKRSPLHWVRFRVLQRQAIFVIPPSLLLSTELSSSSSNNETPTEPSNTNHFKGCQNCDSKAVRSLAQLLLEVYAFVTMLLHDNNNGMITASANATAIEQREEFKDSTLLSIKNHLIQFLLQSILAPSQDGEEDGQDAFYKLDKLHEALSNFADQEIQQSKASRLFKSILTLSASLMQALPTFRQRHQISQFRHVCDVLGGGGTTTAKTTTIATTSSLTFPEDERNAIAFCCIKSLDRYHQLQCDNMLGCKGNESCDYQWMPCVNANKGCTAILSKLYLESHSDDECQYKPMECDLCGMAFVKYQQLHHYQDVCPLRDAPCPFSHLGCLAILKAQDIPRHLEATTSAHLLLALQRMKEYELQISKLHHRMNAMEQDKEKLQDRLRDTSLQQQSDTNILERRLKEMQQRLYGLESSTTRDMRRLHDRQKAFVPK